MRKDRRLRHKYTCGSKREGKSQERRMQRDGNQLGCLLLLSSFYGQKRSIYSLNSFISIIDKRLNKVILVN